MSQYIATLNQPSPQQDLLADPVPDDFSDFLNAEFYDVSNSHTVGVDFNSPGDFNINFDSNQSRPLKTDEAFQHSPTSASANMDFNLNGKHSVVLYNEIPYGNGLASSRSTWCNGQVVSPYARPMASGEGHADPAALCCLHRHPTLGRSATHETLCICSPVAAHG